MKNYFKVVAVECGREAGERVRERVRLCALVSFDDADVRAVLLAYIEAVEALQRVQREKRGSGKVSVFRRPGWFGPWQRLQEVGEGASEEDPEGTDYRRLVAAERAA